MQYAIINGRTHELLVEITFYSIYSHLNWVETLMWQWCTAIESCLPLGWPPRAVQMWSENESRYSAAGRRSERSDRNPQAALLPAVYLNPHWKLQQRWWPAEWSPLVRNTGVTPRRGDTCWDLRADVHKLFQTHNRRKDAATACMLMCNPPS